MNTCPSCGTTNEANAKFCGSCGTNLQVAPQNTPYQPQGPYGGVPQQQAAYGQMGQQQAPYSPTPQQQAPYAPMPQHQAPYSPTPQQQAPYGQQPWPTPAPPPAAPAWPFYTAIAMVVLSMFPGFWSLCCLPAIAFASYGLKVTPKGSKNRIGLWVCLVLGILVLLYVISILAG